MHFSLMDSVSHNIIDHNKINKFLKSHALTTMHSFANFGISNKMGRIDKNKILSNHAQNLTKNMF